MRVKFTEWESLKIWAASQGVELHWIGDFPLSRKIDTGGNLRQALSAYLNNPNQILFVGECDLWKPSEPPGELADLLNKKYLRLLPSNELGLESVLRAKNRFIPSELEIQLMMRTIISLSYQQFKVDILHRIEGIRSFLILFLSKCVPERKIGNRLKEYVEWANAYSSAFLVAFEKLEKCRMRFADDIGLLKTSITHSHLSILTNQIDILGVACNNLQEMSDLLSKPSCIVEEAAKASLFFAKGTEIFNSLEGTAANIHQVMACAVQLGTREL